MFDNSKTKTDLYAATPSKNIVCSVFRYYRGQQVFKIAIYSDYSISEEITRLSVVIVRNKRTIPNLQRSVSYRTFSGSVR